MKKIVFTNKEFDLIIIALSYYHDILQHKIEGETDSEKPDKKKIKTYQRNQKNAASLRSQLIISNEIGEYNHEK